jgi:hypothetical protein
MGHQPHPTTKVVERGADLDGNELTSYEDADGNFIQLEESMHGTSVVYVWKNGGLVGTLPSGLAEYVS